MEDLRKSQKNRIIEKICYIRNYNKGNNKMKKLDKIKIKNFKSIRNAEIELNDLNKILLEKQKLIVNG